jgi:hypothetical protein
MTLTAEEIKKIGPYAWPGGYPLFFLDKENNVLCYDCAIKEDYSYPIVAYDANWEDPHLFCDDCGKRIESAYAEDEDDDVEEDLDYDIITEDVIWGKEQE